MKPRHHSHWPWLGCVPTPAPTTVVNEMDWWDKRGFSREIIVFGGKRSAGFHELTQAMYTYQWHCQTQFKFYLIWENFSALLSVCLSLSICYNFPLHLLQFPSISLSICYNPTSTNCTLSVSVSHFDRAPKTRKLCWGTSEQEWGANRHIIDLQRHALLVILLHQFFFFLEV